MPGGLDAEIEKLRQNLNGLPQPQVELPFIVVSGLASMGKSFFCRKPGGKAAFSHSGKRYSAKNPVSLPPM